MNRVFNFAEAAAAASWQPINDSVWAGIRQPLRFDPAGHAVFRKGVPSSATGLRSVRCLPQAFAIERAAGLADRGARRCKAYKLNLRTDDGFDGVNYQTRFRPAAGAWGQLLSGSGRLPTYLARASRARCTAACSHWLRQVGLMIADRQAGPFRLAVRCISAIPAAVP